MKDINISITDQGYVDDMNNLRSRTVFNLKVDGVTFKTIPFHDGGYYKLATILAELLEMMVEEHGANGETMEEDDDE
jgi:hypothetical protein